MKRKRPAPDRWPTGTPKIPPQMCRQCGYLFDAASATRESGGKKRIPKAGSVSICMNCGDLTVFDKGLRLRPPTPEELADPDVQELAARGKRAVILANFGDLAKKGGRA